MSDSSQIHRRRGAVAVIKSDAKLLVIRRSQTVAAPGKFCFPGGGIEDGESETDALKRELTEELNVTVRPLRQLWTSTTTWDVWLAWWYAEIEEISNLRPNPDEVESVHWLTPAEMLALPDLLESNREFIHSGVLRTVFGDQ
ncbi:MAG: 8-oxo-dGTP diphosphatase [Pirellulaceae bacterium]|jgi:8-oxo-dGTP diphosphatase